MSQPFTDAQELQRYLETDSVAITLKSLDTGQEFNYEFKRPSKEQPGRSTRFVLLQTQGSRQYIGNYSPFTALFFTTRKTPAFLQDHPAIEGLKWLTQQMRNRNLIPPTVSVRKTEP